MRSPHDNKVSQAIQIYNKSSPEIIMMTTAEALKLKSYRNCHLLWKISLLDFQWKTVIGVYYFTARSENI